jgi:hypothetical protein
MWSLVEHNLAELEDWYAGRISSGVTALANDVYNFFVTCYAFKEHLRHDSAVPEVARGAVAAYVRASTALSLTGDIANTLKHHTRSDPNARTASIAAITIANTPSAAIGWIDRVSSTSESQDSLVLAHEAVADWRAFLHQAGLL